MTRAPRAFRLDAATPEEGAARPHTAVAVLPESEPLDPAQDENELAARRKGFRWGRLFVAALGAFLTLSFGIWIEQTLVRLMNASPLLGYAGLAAAALGLLALGVMLVKVLVDMLRERRVEALHRRALEVMAGGSLDEAKRIAGELQQLYAKRPETAKGRAELVQALPQLFAARDVLSVAERSLLTPLDATAQALIAQAARRVSLVTAVSPRALIDIVFVLAACARLLSGIAGVYSGRPGALGLLRLGRQVFSHLIITGGIAAGDALIQQVLGHGLAAKLSAKLGEGVLNGILTARVGLAALDVCRPLPFVEASRPTLSDVAGDLLSWRDKGGSSS